jgi:hypothetical protein
VATLFTDEQERARMSGAQVSERHRAALGSLYQARLNQL